ncbi:MAG: nucleoside hydrolase [Bacteroidota bacterium]
MKNVILLLALCFFIQSCTTTPSSPPEQKAVALIFDTDFGGDADDLGALAMLHHFVDQGECDLMAVMCWSLETHAVAGIDAVNHYYGHPDIPIGARQGATSSTDWNYSQSIASSFPHDLDHQSAEDATVLYRKLLAQSEDSSVLIVTVGPLMNIQLLLQSAADSISPLNGKELIERKVKEVVIMGGQFPSGEKEWNFDGDMPGVTQFVLEQLRVPIVFSGYEVGLVIRTGAVFNELDPATPLYVGFKYFSEHAPWIKENYQGKILDNATYDQTAVLYAVKGGLGKYWTKVEGGYCQADSIGGNEWISGTVSNHSYLKLLMDTEELAGIIESMMMGRSAKEG